MAKLDIREISQKLTKEMEKTEENRNQDLVNDLLDFVLDNYEECDDRKENLQDYMYVLSLAQERLGVKMTKMSGYATWIQQGYYDAKG